MPSKGYRKATPRNHTIRLRVTEEERKQLESASKKHPQGVSGWIRDVIFGEIERGPPANKGTPGDAGS